MEVLELAVRVETDRGLLNALTSKVLAQHDPSIKSSFVNTRCWDAATSRVQMGNWAQLTDQLRKSIMIKSPTAIMTKDLKLYDTFLTMRMGPQESQIVDKAVLEHLKVLNPILRHIITVKLVCNQRRNLINIRVRRELLPTIHHYSAGMGLHIFFTMNDQLQPYVRITAIREDSGELTQPQSFTSDVWSAIAAGAEQVRPSMTRESRAEPAV